MRHDRVQLKVADRDAWRGFKIDIKTGSCVDWFRIDCDIVELYEGAVISGFATPMVISYDSPELARLITWDKVGAGQAMPLEAAAETAAPAALDSSQEHSTDLRSEAQGAPAQVNSIKLTRKTTVQ